MYLKPKIKVLQGVLLFHPGMSLVGRVISPVDSLQGLSLAVRNIGSRGKWLCTNCDPTVNSSESAWRTLGGSQPCPWPSSLLGKWWAMQDILHVVTHHHTYRGSQSARAGVGSTGAWVAHTADLAFPSSGGCKSQSRMPAPSARESPFLACRWQPSHCVLRWQRESESESKRAFTGSHLGVFSGTGPILRPRLSPPLPLGSRSPMLLHFLDLN